MKPTEDKEAMLTIPEIEAVVKADGDRHRLTDLRLRQYIVMNLSQIEKLERLGYHKDETARAIAQAQIEKLERLDYHKCEKE